MARKHVSRDKGNLQNYKDLTSKIDKLIKSIDNLYSVFNKTDKEKEKTDKKEKENKPIRRKSTPIKLDDLRSRMNMEKNNTSSSMQNTGRGMELLAQRMKHSQNAGKATSKFASLLEVSGKGLNKFGAALGKAKGGVLMFVSFAVELIGKASKAIADADKRQQDIQNRRNTLITQRNITLSNIETENISDAINTEYTRQMSLFKENVTKLKGEQDIENQKAIANAAAQIGSTIGDINTTAWERLAAETDINAMRDKLKLEVGDGTTQGRVQQKEQRVRDLAYWEYQGRMSQREYEQRKTLLDAEAENAKLNMEAVRNAGENPLSESTNYIVGGRIHADNVYGEERFNQNYGKEGTESNNRFENYSTKTKIATAASAGAINSATSLVGLDFGGVIDASITKAETTLGRDITNAKNQLDYNTAVQNNFIKAGTAYYENAFKASDEIIDQVTEAKTSIIDTNANILKMYQKMAQTVEDWTLKFQDMSYKTGIGVGLTNKEQLGMFTSYMNSVTSKLSADYGMTAEEVFALQEGYKPNGRNKLLNRSDFDKQASFSKIYLGGDVNTASELANNTEIFNMGVSDTVDLMSEMAKKVNKIGLDGRKYMKDLTGYLKQANKYTFKDGVKGVAEMAKWAKNVRFNMDTLPQILENIQGGGLENVITKAAKIQVLGGRYAMFADPLAMYYEAYNDPDALAKRFNNMSKGMGRFDSKTGNVVFGQVEQELMRAFAEASGQSLEDIRSQAIYNIKKDRVYGINKNLNEEQKQSLVNKAYYKDGEWKVNDINGNEVSVSDINSNNINMVQGTTYEETMENGMKQITSFIQQFSGNKESNLSQLAQAITDDGTFYQEMTERLVKGQETYAKNFNEYVSSIEKNMEAATDAYSGALGSMVGDFKTKGEETVEAINKFGTDIVYYLKNIYSLIPGHTDSVFDEQPSKKENDNVSNRDKNPVKAHEIPTSSSVGGNISTNTSNNRSTVNPYPITNVNESISVPFKSPEPRIIPMAERMNNKTDTLNVSPVDVNVNGSIKLDVNGTQIDFINMLENNPLLIRKITEMTTNEIGKKINGGRGIPNYPYLEK